MKTAITPMSIKEALDTTVADLEAMTKEQSGAWMGRLPIEQMTKSQLRETVSKLKVAADRQLQHADALTRLARDLPEQRPN